MLWFVSPAARLTPIKGYQYQLQAIAKLKNLPIWPQLYFVWAGPGSTTHDNMEPELRATVSQLGVTEQVKFIGQRWDIADWLDASDIFILSSKAEGMPLAVMEAMAKGLPVIATAVSGIPEELGDTGKLIPDPTIDSQQTAQELAATVELWAQNPELRRLAGQACKLRAEELFKEERMVLEYAEVVAQVLSASSNRDEFALAKPSKRIAPKVQKQIEKVDSMLYYYYLVWQAWQAWDRGDMSGMLEKLQSAWKCTPLLTSETILSWITNFVALSSEKGVQLDTYSLIHSEAWQELMELVQGFEVALSVR